MARQHHLHLGQVNRRSVIAALVRATDRDEITWHRHRIHSGFSSNSVVGYAATYEGTDVGFVPGPPPSLHVWVAKGCWQEAYSVFGMRDLKRAMREYLERHPASGRLWSVDRVLSSILDCDAAELAMLQIEDKLADLTTSGDLVWKSSGPGGYHCSHPTGKLWFVEGKLSVSVDGRNEVVGRCHTLDYVIVSHGIEQSAAPITIKAQRLSALESIVRPGK